MYEPCWIHPDDAEVRDISDGDVIMVHNDRGAVLVGAVVTERIVPGALSIDHGAKIDLVRLNGQARRQRRMHQPDYADAERKVRERRGDKDPEMNVSGFLVEAVKINASDIVASSRHGPRIDQIGLTLRQLRR